MVLEKQVSQMQRALEVRQHISTPVKLRMEVVWDKLPHEFLEKCVDTC
jgi:hypothetical protein